MTIDDLSNDLIVPLKFRYRAQRGKVTHIFDNSQAPDVALSHCGLNLRKMRTTLAGSPFCKNCLKGYRNAQ